MPRCGRVANFSAVPVCSCLWGVGCVRGSGQMGTSEQYRLLIRSTVLYFTDLTTRPTGSSNSNTRTRGLGVRSARI